MNVACHLKSSDRLKQEIKYSRIIDFIRILYTVQDAIRNSVNSYGQKYFSPKQLHGKNVNEVKEMLLKIGIDWDKAPIYKKYGTSCYRDLNETEEGKDNPVLVDFNMPIPLGDHREFVERHIIFKEEDEQSDRIKN